jgi:sugar phosphate isomerase/epimerase
MPNPPIPQIQCSTGPFWTFELEHALDLIAAAGFEAIELMITRDLKTQDPAAVLELAAERSLRVAAVHGPFLVLTRSVWGFEALGKVRRGLEVCRALGAKTLVVHPPYLWEHAYARWLGDGDGGEPGIDVAVETMYPVWVAGRPLRAYRWLDPARLLSGSPSIVLDTSHVALTQIDIVKAYELLAPKIVHIHLSDNALDNRDGHLALGEGLLPINDFLEVVRRTQYSGTIALELSVARLLGNSKELVSMLKRNREHVAEALDNRPRLAHEEPS